MQAISNAKNHGHFTQVFFVHVFSQNLTLVYNSVCLNLTRKVKVSVPLLHHLESTNTWDFQWDSNAHQTLLNQQWKMYCQASKMLMSILMMLVLSLIIGMTLSILRRLCEHGFTINPIKCEWVVNETDWLGYWLSPRCLKPWKKKIDTILHMDCLCNTTELRMFIGCVNYNHDMWPSCVHILKPLTDQSGLKKRAHIFNGLMTFNKHLTKCTCLWLSMLLQLIRTTPNGSMYMLMPLTSSYAHALSKKEGRVPTSCKCWQNLSKIIQQWKRKCFPLLQLSKNFEVCSLVQTFII